MTFAQGTDVDASWGNLGIWSPCSSNCGTGTRERWQECNIAQGHGSPAVCTKDRKITESCSIRVDSFWGSWYSWSPCPSACGPAQRKRRRFCQYPFRQCRGNDCPGENQQSESCLNPCPTLEPTTPDSTTFDPPTSAEAGVSIAEDSVSQATLIVAVVVSSVVTLSLGLVIALTIAFLKRKKRGTMM